MSETQYGKYFLTEPRLRRKAYNPGITKPKAVLQSGPHFDAGSFTMCWECITQPMVMDPLPHTHEYDEYLAWMGGNAEDVFDFDAEIEVFMGEEGERHIVDKATVLYIPAGLVHCPIHYIRIGKPVLFNVIAFDPAYYDSPVSKTFFIRKGEEEQVIAEVRSTIDQYNDNPARVENIKEFLKEQEKNKGD